MTRGALNSRRSEQRGTNACRAIGTRTYKLQLYAMKKDGHVPGTIIGSGV